MEEKDKLRILIPHWITHNNEHATEFRDWAILNKDVSADINAAADAVALANESLLSALEKLGGATFTDSFSVIRSRVVFTVLVI